MRLELKFVLKTGDDEQVSSVEFIPFAGPQRRSEMTTVYLVAALIKFSISPITNNVHGRNQSSRTRY
jgi:hypothetical protein